MNKVGIITFHHSYNCGSMMQAFAMQTVVEKLGYKPEIINFSNEGQRRLYKTWFQANSLRNIVKNAILLFHQDRLNYCNRSYEHFMTTYMKLSAHEYCKNTELADTDYDAVIAGSDQIWNITIDDSDDAYFLSWVRKAKRIAYAPSFGAKNILEYAKDSSIYSNYLNKFECISIRENNGQKWIKELTGRDVPVVLDPTLLLSADDYQPLVEMEVKGIPSKFIFYYAPHYDTAINRLVEKISNKLNLPVVAFNSKSFYVKQLNKLGFVLPEKENPSVYLYLIKNAELVITTSFHGTVFSSIYRKKFWTVKNGGMFGSDDRVLTLTNMLDLDDRLIPIDFNVEFDYLKEKDFSSYEHKLKNYKKKSIDFLANALELEC